MTHFKVVVSSYECPRWILTSLLSIEQQNYTDYDVVVIDDASSSQKQRDIISDFCSRNGWKKIFNAENKGALYNIVQGIKSLNPNDDDVIVILDGDDSFYNKKTLSILNRYYSEQDIHLTYGQYIHRSTWKIGYSKPVTEEVIREKKFRSIPWCLSHLRSFTYFLWRHIKDEDLRNEKGEYYRSATDLATMYPMIEMAGFHFTYIDELLYIYNDTNPLNIFATRRAKQLAYADQIRSRPPYPTLFEGRCRWNSRTPLTRCKMAVQKTIRRSIALLSLQK